MTLSLLPCPASGDDVPTAQTLIQSYRQTLTSAQRIAFRAETKTSVEGALSPAHPWLQRQYYRRDGRRLDVQEETVRIGNDGQVMPGGMVRLRSIVDGQRWYHFRNDFRSEDIGNSNLLLTSTKPETWGERTRRMLSDGTALDGYLPGDDGAALWEVLARPTSLRVREAMETVDGHQTYVLEGKSQYGEYTLWIDPESGFNARRISVRKVQGDLLGGRPVGDPPPDLPEKAIASYRQTAVAKYTFVADSIRIEKIGDAYLPVEANFTTTYNNADASVFVFHRSQKRTEVDLNPNFDAMNAFVLTGVPNGTIVINKDVAVDEMGVILEWRDGRVVPKFDPSVIDEIDRAVAEEVVSAQERRKAVPAAADPDANAGSAGMADRAPTWSSTRILAVVLVAACAAGLAILAWRYKCRRHPAGG